MTAYVAQFPMTSSLDPGGSGQITYSAAVIATIRAGVNAVRIIRLSANGAYGITSGNPGYGGSSAALTRYSNSTIAGGVSLTPTAARELSDPASATVRYQALTFISQTSTWTPGSPVTITGSPVQFGGFTTKWDPPSEIVIAPGSTIHIRGMAPYTSGSPYNPFLAGFEIWFDEEHVARSV